MKKESNNIIKLILNNKKVNNYTKLMIILSQYDYFEDYYIPNKKLMNILKIHKRNVISLLHQLEEDNIIKLFYKGRKRYFVFLRNTSSEKEINIIESKELFDYDWLNDEEVI